MEDLLEAVDDYPAGVGGCVVASPTPQFFRMGGIFAEARDGGGEGFGVFRRRRDARAGFIDDVSDCAVC